MELTDVMVGHSVHYKCMWLDLFSAETLLTSIIMLRIGVIALMMLTFGTLCP